MSGLKTLLSALALALLAASPARAIEDLPRIFANCAGQLSAMVEHAWLMQDPRAERFEQDRARFLDLLDAVDGPSQVVSLNRRIEAKSAQATLLRVATFGADRHAADRAEAQVAACSLLLLGG